MLNNNKKNLLGQTTTSGIRGKSPSLCNWKISRSVWPWALKSRSMPSIEYSIFSCFKHSMNSVESMGFGKSSGGSRGEIFLLRSRSNVSKTQAVKYGSGRSLMGYLCN